MPIYQLNKTISFPHPSLAEEGILAIGGDLSVERLTLAYQHGIFPWYNEDEPIIWHFPEPRFVLEPNELKVSKSMRQFIRNNSFRISINEDFEGVINACKQQKRKEQDGTWIHPAMKEAYLNLHTIGLAHSIEVWDNKDLIGGLYGVNIGSVFFGESMFHKKSNASKLAFITLVQQFSFTLIDCQVYTKHLASLGAKKISSKEFYKRIVKETQNPPILNRNINFVDIEN